MCREEAGPRESGVTCETSRFLFFVSFTVILLLWECKKPGVCEQAWLRKKAGRIVDREACDISTKKQKKKVSLGFVSTDEGSVFVCVRTKLQ